ncbi:vesicle coat component [Serendipita sp. 396]|nr:vesicle coat component [Serendipita sp. 396]KAG8785664.1 vesicle coat component [Serendipita sp. 397]KAG8801379.1 vesicle coat component [Serendipita sp. 398]KAG8824412.1 vesicle coat component [Serendipita sp. 401]KAG8857496.1 vesicle coat component [Serendipita sp. 411]KAG8873910.1 vesicle coat component [Serendipita sp. 405]KAG9055576.1 vesicle coat component [Serendipita sp. 407]
MNSHSPRQRQTAKFSQRHSRPTHSRTSFPLLVYIIGVLLLLFVQPAEAIKFKLLADRYPQPKCIWNTAHENALVIVTANVGPGASQRVDIEIVDSSPRRNVYLSKRGVNGETRLAVTAHADGDVGVCFKNHLDLGHTQTDAGKYNRIVDLDVDIGADAVDYNAIAAKESLSGLETEMRKLEGLVTEIVDEMAYLKRREERFQSTNHSTNIRVQNFSLFSLCALIVLGIWQIFHLRAFFKRKYLID